MNLKKIVWAIRYLYLRPFFNKSGTLGYIGAPVLLSGLAQFRFGNKVRIYPNARIECLNTDCMLDVRDSCSFGQGLHIICANKIIISEDCLFSSNVFVSDCDHGNNVVDQPYWQQELKVSKVEIGKNCFIGRSVSILAGTELGRNCIVAAHSVVRGTFPDDVMIAGAPAKIIKRYDHDEHKWKG